ncbi:hypothetical protein L6R53_20590 [Myxococcota bacterium]|nr:hypothetical protein [Myxococcota bacterium]
MSLAAFLLLGLAHAARPVLTVGADGSTPPPALPAAPPISLDLVDADLHSVLRLFSAHSGVGFVLDERVKGTVTMRLEDVPWDQALWAVLATHGLGAVPVGAVPVGQDATVWVVAPLD